MTAHHSNLTGAAPIPPPVVHAAKHPLPARNLEEFARDVVVFTMTAADIGPLMKRAETDLPGLASREAVLRVMAHNPDSVWGIARSERYRGGVVTAEGFVGS